jgi:alpha-1,6-mannosyltransferase
VGQFFLKNRLLPAGLLSAVVYAVNFDVGDLLVQLGTLNVAPHPIVSYLIQIATLSVFYVAALWVVGRVGENDRQSLVPAILFFALLFRLFLVPANSVLSSDIYRYFWDGRVQVAGKMNPYLYPPVDEQLAFLRDGEIYPYINRKDAPTLYPAGAQILFRALNQLALDSPAEFKAAALAAEALTFLFVFLILKELGLPLSRIVIYAWNPLIIYELFYSGHLESFMLPPLMGFVYLFLRRRPIAAGALLGLAASIKLVPALLLVTIPPGKRLRIALPFFAVFALIYLPYAGAGKAVLGFLPVYFYDPYEIFNPGLFQIALLETAKFMSLPSSSIRFVLFICFLVILIQIIRRTEEDRAHFLWKCYVVVAGYLFLIYPALHPWYLSMLIPFLCVIPSRAWLYFSLALPLSYLKYLTPDGAMPAWVSLIEFIPLYIVLALEYARTQPLTERRSQWYLGTQTPSSTTL